MRHYTNTNNPVDFPPPDKDRVGELMGRALDLAVPETWTRLDADQLTRYSRKLVDLLIQECMEQVWYSREDGINGNVSQVIKDRIKQHFGVE